MIHKHPSRKQPNKQIRNKQAIIKQRNKSQT